MVAAAVSRVVIVDKGWKSWRKRVPKIGRLVAKVGFFGPVITARAAKHEFGDPARNVPERPFMGHAFDAGLGPLGKTMDAQIGPMQLGTRDVREALARVGKFHAEQIVGSIGTAIQWAAPLAPKTIAQKGHNRPLVETTKMVNSVKFKVAGRPRTKR